MSIALAEIGQTYIMGNTYNPETCKVTHLVGFTDLSEREQRAWTQISGAEQARAAAYVWYESKRTHDTFTANLCLPADVFCHCAYYSAEAFYGHPQSNTGAGLLRATLPGER